MNEKYALQPECIQSSLQFKYVFEKFGFHEGRFLAEFPKAWKRALFEHIAKLPNIEQLRIKRILELDAGCATLRMGLDFDSRKTWVENAKIHKTTGSLKDVFAVDDEDLLSIDNIDDNTLADGRGERVIASADNLVRLLEPLIQQSSEIYFVDPYISLGKLKYLKFIRKLLESPLSKQKNFRFFSLHEHFICKEDSEVIVRRELLPFLKTGSSVEFCTIGSDVDMHGRYAFSIKGALKYDKGFQVDERTVIDVEAVSRLIHDAYFDKYNTKAADLGVIHSYSISSNG